MTTDILLLLLFFTCAFNTILIFRHYDMFLKRINLITKALKYFDYELKLINDILKVLNEKQNEPD
jgi:hypothetical protein